MDPTLLHLIPDTVHHPEDDRAVTQIKMNEVAAEKAGIAFGTLADIGPFLKEDRSITLDALAVLTTAPNSTRKSWSYAGQKFALPSNLWPNNGNCFGGWLNGAIRRLLHSSEAGIFPSQCEEGLHSNLSCDSLEGGMVWELVRIHCLPSSMHH